MDSTAEWTVMTWNVHGSERPRVGDLAPRISERSPDVVALQEVRWWQARRLACALGMKVNWQLKHYPFGRLGFPFAEGAAILSPHGLGTTGVRVISEDQSTTTFRRRIVQWAVVGRPDGSAIRLFNVHLSPGEFRDDRRSESVRVTSLATGFDPVPPVVVAGDLNDHDEPEIIDLLPGIEHLRPSPTNPADHPHQVLDHVLLPASAEAASTSVPAGSAEWAELSDHLPVTVRFQLPRQT
jgi:endonuclease/exonuclease/phosphatase family metal-dependent hydrolase